MTKFLGNAYFSSKFLTCAIFFRRSVCTTFGLPRRPTICCDNRTAKMLNRRQRAEQAEFHAEAHRRVEEKSVPASLMFLQVLGNGHKGSARSLLVFTDQFRYMFNCGEGTQRLANEYRAKLSRLDHVFVTHRSWENVGGLPGLVLTIQNMGVPKITLHGPTNIEKLFQITKGFMITEDIEIVKKNVTDGSYHDHIMSVDYVALHGSKSGVDGRSKIVGEPSAGAGNPDVISAKELEQPHKRRRIDPEMEELSVSVAYICRATNKPGQLLLEKCVDQGVPPGPLLGQLKSGKDVTLKSGKIVKSSDVVSPDEPGPVFIVLECPTVDFLDSLLVSDAFAAYQEGASSVCDVAAVVVHFSPADVIKHDKYQEWMNRFHSSTDHLIINDVNVGPSSCAVHIIQHKLNLLHPKIFPLLKEEILSTNREADDRNGVLHSAVHSQMNLKYHLRPLHRIDRSALVTLAPDEYLRECMNIPTFPDVLSDLKSKLEEFEKTSDGCKYPEIVFLGTGSSIPSKVRNTSGILLNICEDKSILMDCGEATYSQIYRFYGEDDVDAVMRRISAIYVSHLHADHHIGFIQLLKERRRAFARQDLLKFAPVTLMAPSQISAYLQSYDEFIEPILDDFRLVSNVTFFSLEGRESDEKYVDVVTNLGMDLIDTVYVRHCPNAFGVALTHKTGWKLVYSGDTMPCDGLINIGRNCDVLIHEATMEDDLKEEALYKKHSCTSEAVEVGRRMNAKFIILTHFSQRYAKVPIYNDSFRNNVGIAFDNMRVALSDLGCLPHFTNSLKTMFSEELEDMLEKTAKKKRRKILAADEAMKLTGIGGR